MSARILIIAWLMCACFACQNLPNPVEPSPQEATPDAANEAPPERKAAIKGSIGTTCQSQDTCETKLQCETRIPKGYCTKSCTSTTECPNKSACVRIKFEDGTAFLRCLRTCHTNVDCRDDFYCYHPPGAWKLICLPKDAKPQP